MRIALPFRKSGSLIAVADIGGSGASVAFVRVRSHGPSELLVCAHAPIPLGDRDSDHAIVTVAGALKEAAAAAIASAADARLPAAQTLYVIVHAPWVSSKTLTAEREFPAETRVTDALIGELGREALERASQARESLYEANVSHVELNGYTARVPRGLTAHHIKVVALVGEMDRTKRDALGTVLQAAFPGLELKWRSHTRAMSTLLHESDDGRNAVVVEIADEGTSITVMRKQELTASVVVPMGLHRLLGQIAPQGSREEALALMSMLERGTCSTAECERMSEGLVQAEAALTKSLGEPLGVLAANRRLPNDLFVLAHADIAPWFVRFFARLDFAQFTVTAQPFSAHALLPADFARLVTIAPGVRADASLCMAAALVHTEQLQ